MPTVLEFELVSYAVYTIVWLGVILRPDLSTPGPMSVLMYFV